MAESLAGFALGLAPPANFDAALAEAFAAASTVLQKVFGEEATSVPFGSIIQGVHLDGSDLDLCFDVPGTSPDPVELGSNGKPDNTKQVAALRRILGGLRGTKFRVIEQRFWKHMKVPIVILGYRGNGGMEIEADVSVGTVFESTQKGFTDRLVRRLLAQSARAMHMVRLVKLWAKVEKLNKAFDGFLNSLGWTLLVLYFLMQRGDLFSSSMHEEEADECGLGGDPSTLPPVLHAREAEGEPTEDELIDAPTCEDLAEFFEFVVAWETWWPAHEPEEPEKNWGISLVDSAVVEVPKPAKVWHDTSKFFIEDPGVRLSTERSENVARSLKNGTWATTLERCQAAAEALRAEMEAGEEASAWCSELQQGLEADKAEKVAPPAAAGWKRPWQAMGGPVQPAGAPPPGLTRPGAGLYPTAAAGAYGGNTMAPAKRPRLIPMVGGGGVCGGGGCGGGGYGGGGYVGGGYGGGGYGGAVCGKGNVNYGAGGGYGGCRVGGGGGGIPRWQAPPNQWR